MATQPHSKDFKNPRRPTWREIRALGYTMPILDPQGLVCPHPVNRLFTSPRRNNNSSPRPRRSRTSILRSLLHDYTSMSPYYHHLLENYISDDDPALLEEEEQERQKAKFPKFMSLPLEIRQMIWVFAVHQTPMRTLFYEAFTHDGYDWAHGIKNLSLPVPLIATVCREARHVVMEMCPWVRITRRPFKVKSLIGQGRDRLLVSNIGRQAIVDPTYELCEQRLGGFFLKDIDVMLLPSEPFDTQRMLKSDWKPEIMLQETRTDTFAAPWADMEQTEYLGRVDQERLLELAKRWWYAGRPTTKRIYVQFNPVDTVIPLYVGSDYGPLGRSNPKDIEIREEIRFVVDLYDNDRLADLDHLNGLNLEMEFKEKWNTAARSMKRWTIPECGWHDFPGTGPLCKNCIVRKEDAELSNLEGLTPRYAGCFFWPNKGNCFNCLRGLWERREKSKMIGFWLILRWLYEGYVLEHEEDDLLTAAQATCSAGVPLWYIFPDAKNPLRYNEKIPWVKEKLLEVPELHPVVTIRLSVHADGQQLPAPDVRSYPEETPDEWYPRRPGSPDSF